MVFACKEFSIPNDTAYLSRVREEVLQLIEGRFDAKEAKLLALAVDEAVANVMEHAYRGDTPKEMQRISARLTADEVKFTVILRDGGQRFDPTSAPDVNISEHVKAGRKGGLGIFLMRKIMDEVNYTFKRGEHNELVMVKYFPNGV
jgi:anti-sigma regulatory factor (Ser/Thr protein kinase)